MTTTAHLYRAIQDEETGELLLGAQVTLCYPGTQNPITQPFFSDVNLTQQLPNPFTADDGYIDIFLANPVTVALITSYGSTMRTADYLSILPNAENLLASPTPLVITNSPSTGQILSCVDSQSLKWSVPEALYSPIDNTILGWFMGFEFSLANVIRDPASGAALGADVIWPDGNTGVYTADAPSTTFPGRVDAWHITWSGGGVSPRTYFQQNVLRDPNGAIVSVPPPVVVDGLVSSLS